jgi:hypothetical protein
MLHEVDVSTEATQEDASYPKRAVMAKCVTEDTTNAYWLLMSLKF